MNATKVISAPEASEEPTFGDEVTEFVPWLAAAVVFGPITLLTLVLCAPFLLLLVLVAAPLAALGLLGAAAAILVLPYLFLRHRHRHFAERPRSAKRSPATAGALASAEGRR